MSHDSLILILGACHEEMFIYFHKEIKQDY